MRAVGRRGGKRVEPSTTSDGDARSDLDPWHGVDVQADGSRLEAGAGGVELIADRPLGATVSAGAADTTTAHGCRRRRGDSDQQTCEQRAETWGNPDKNPGLPEPGYPPAMT